MGKLSVRRFLDELIAVQGGNQKPLRTAQIASNATFHKSSFFCSGVQIFLSFSVVFAGDGLKHRWEY